MYTIRQTCGALSIPDGAICKQEGLSRDLRALPMPDPGTGWEQEGERAGHLCTRQPEENRFFHSPDPNLYVLNASAGKSCLLLHCSEEQKLPALSPLNPGASTSSIPCTLSLHTIPGPRKIILKINKSNEYIIKSVCCIFIFKKETGEGNAHPKRIC